MSSLIGASGLLMASKGVADSVVSLLIFEGASGSTDFPDRKGVVWTASANAQQGVVAGEKSLMLDGNLSRISSASIEAFGFGTGDFTAQCFFTPSVIQTGNRFLFDARVVGGNSWVLWCSQGSMSNVLGWSTEGGTNFVAGDSFTAGLRQHVLVSRQGGIVRGFLAGRLAFTQTDNRDYGTSQGIHIGSSTTSGQGALGSIQSVKITKGVAEYVAPFTPPTSFV